MSSKVVKTIRQLRVPEAHRIEAAVGGSRQWEAEETVKTILAAAETQAQKILAQAKEEARIVLEEARARGWEDGKEAAWQELRQQVTAEWDGLRQPIARILEQVERLAGWTRLAGEENVLLVAKLMAESVLKAAAEEHPEWFASYLGRVIEQIDAGRVRLAVGEHWARSLEALQHSLAAVAAVAESFVDRTLPPFEVRIEAEGQAVVAGIETALDQLVDGVRYGDRLE